MKSDLMPSTALTEWNLRRQSELDELLNAHTMVGGGGRGRRYATEQLNFAYLVAIAAQFQGFCRDLHTEAVGVLAASTSAAVSPILMATFTKNRKLDQGNANDATIAEDFGRIGMANFWAHVERKGGAVHTKTRRGQIEKMNMWRNAIAHNNFQQYQSKLTTLGVLRPRLAHARACRNAAKYLAKQMAAAVSDHLAQIVGAAPW